MADALDRVYLSLLVVRGQAGDESAFAELVARTGPRLRYFVRSLVGEAADDVAQLMWLDIWRGLPRLTDPAAFPAWAYRVARDRCYRHLRQRPPPASLTETEVPDDAPAFSPADAAEVHVALAELPAGPRELLVLRFLDELSYDDQAAVLSVPVGTVRSRLHHAKKALRIILERRAGDG
jgi:RNA polymerase sigma-70 factor (ECF subfamily)